MLVEGLEVSRAGGLNCFRVAPPENTIRNVLLHLVQRKTKRLIGLKMFLFAILVDVVGKRCFMVPPFVSYFSLSSDSRVSTQAKVLLAELFQQNFANVKNTKHEALVE